jgi:hypothetical protein
MLGMLLQDVGHDADSALAAFARLYSEKTGGLVWGQPYVAGSGRGDAYEPSPLDDTTEAGCGAAYAPISSSVSAAADLHEPLQHAPSTQDGSADGVPEVAMGGRGGKNKKKRAPVAARRKEPHGDPDADRGKSKAKSAASKGDRNSKHKKDTSESDEASVVSKASSSGGGKAGRKKLRRAQPRAASSPESADGARARKLDDRGHNRGDNRSTVKKLAVVRRHSSTSDSDSGASASAYAPAAAATSKTDRSSVPAPVDVTRAREAALRQYALSSQTASGISIGASLARVAVGDVGAVLDTLIDPRSLEAGLLAAGIAPFASPSHWLRSLGSSAAAGHLLKATSLLKHLNDAAAAAQTAAAVGDATARVPEELAAELAAFFPSAGVASEVPLALVSPVCRPIGAELELRSAQLAALSQLHQSALALRSIALKQRQSAVDTPLLDVAFASLAHTLSPASSAEINIVAQAFNGTLDVDNRSSAGHLETMLSPSLLRVCRAERLGQDVFGSAMLPSSSSDNVEAHSQLLWWCGKSAAATVGVLAHGFPDTGAVARMPRISYRASAYRMIKYHY